MVRVLGSSEVCGMARVAISWSTGEACGVALGTSGRGVNAGKREVRGSVVKVRIQPVV